MKISEPFGNGNLGRCLCTIEHIDQLDLSLALIVAMDLPSPPAAAAAVSESAGSLPKGWAAKDAWNAHRALISHLYANNTLPEVMRIMEAKHGFKATLADFFTAFPVSRF